MEKVNCRNLIIINVLKVYKIHCKFNKCGWALKKLRGLFKKNPGTVKIMVVCPLSDSLHGELGMDSCEKKRKMAENEFSRLPSIELLWAYWPIPISKSQHQPLISPHIFRKVKPAISHRLATPVAAERLYEIIDEVGVDAASYFVHRPEEDLVLYPIGCILIGLFKNYTLCGIIWIFFIKIYIVLEKKTHHEGHEVHRDLTEKACAHRTQSK